MRLFFPFRRETIGSPPEADFDDHKLSLTLHYTLPCRLVQVPY